MVRAYTRQQKLEEAGTCIPVPDKSEALYVGPNPDGSRKSCANCMMWSRDNRCTIHAADLKITGDMVCGYHVYGDPLDKRIDHLGLDAVTPKESGLIVAPKGGTSCDNCYFFTAAQHCAALDGKPKVHPKGCCSRWDGAGAKEVKA